MAQRVYHDEEPTLGPARARRSRGGTVWEGSRGASGRRMSTAEHRRLLEETQGADDETMAARIRAESDPDTDAQLRRLGRRPDPLRNPTGRAARESRRFQHPMHLGTGAAGRHVPKRGAGSFPRPTLRPSMADGSGFALGLLLYVLGLNYLRAGWPGIHAWFQSKFFNDVTAAADLRSLPGVLGVPGVPKTEPGAGGVLPPITQAPGVGPFDPRNPIYGGAAPRVTP